jgi:hypothetical protein
MTSSQINSPVITLLPHTVASLDLESLSLDQNAVIHEIGVVFTNFLPFPGTLWTLSDIPFLTKKTELVESVNPTPAWVPVFYQARIALSVAEQVLMGRVVDTSTLDFHKSVFKKKQKVFSVEMLEQQKESLTIDAARTRFDTLFKTYAPEQVWVNHTSFDVPRINNLLYDSKPNALPWTYRKEHDIHSAKTIFRSRVKTDRDPLRFTDSGNDSDIHDSVADCLYNLSALSICLYFNS